MAAWPPADLALAGKIPPPPPFVKGGLGGFESYFLANEGERIWKGRRKKRRKEEDR